MSTPYGTTPETANATLLLPVEKVPPGRQIRTSTLSAALELQSKVFLSLGAGAGVLFILGLALLVVKIYVNKKDEESERSEDEEPRPMIRFLEVAPQKVLVLSTVLSFLAAVSITQIVNALEYATTQIMSSPESLVIMAGKMLQGRQWSISVISVRFLFCLWRWDRRSDDEAEEDTSESDIKAEKGRAQVIRSVREPSQPVAQARMRQELPRENASQDRQLPPPRRAPRST